MTPEVKENNTATPENAAPPAPKPAAKKRKAKKRIKRIIALVVVLALLAGGGWALWHFVFNTPVEQGELLRDVARIDSIQSMIEGSGNATAKDMAAITLSASGTVQEVYVSQGEQVYEGQLLYTVVSPAAQEAVTTAQNGVRAAEDAVITAQDGVVSAQEAVEAAREGITTAEDNVQAAKDAVGEAEQAVLDAQQGVVEAQQGVVDAQQGVADAQQGVADAKQGVTEAKQGVVTAQNGVTEAQAIVTQKNAELRTLRGRSSELTITAPFSGKIIEVGANAAVGKELGEGEAVFTLANDKTMKFSLYFSYAYENSIYVGQSATVTIPSTMSTRAGKVTAINKVNRVVPEGASLFEVVIEISNPGTLTKGMEATATMTAADGTAIYPYENGKLDYGETRQITTKLPGPVTSVKVLQYTDVTVGQTLLVQGSDGLNKLIEAKQQEIKDAEKAVEDAKDGVTAAQKRVTEAEKGVEQAEKGVEAAQKQVTAAEKGVEAAQKQVTAAEKGVEQAQKNVQQAEKGVEQAIKGVEQAERGVTQAQQRVADAEQGVLDAQEKVAEAERALEDLNAVAPIDGTVISCTINPGDEVQMGATVMTISNTTNMVVEITVDDRNISFVTPGMMVELSDYNGNMWFGTVTNINMNPSSDNMGSGTTNYPVTLTVDNYDGSLLSGQWLQYSFVASQSDNCIIVPIQSVKSALDDEGNEVSVVFLESETRPDNAVTMPEQSPDQPKTFPTEEDGFYAVPVVIGLSDTYNVEIVSGLNEGDTVFTNYLTASGSYWGW